MKKSILFFVCSNLFITAIAQAQWSSKDRIKGNGTVKKETRTTESYDAIKLSGFFDIDLVAGTEGKISVEGEENLLPFVKVEVSYNVLKIFVEKDKNIRCSKGENIKITIPFETLNEVSLSGSGDIQTKNTIKSKTFSAHLSGSGDLKLAIETTDFEVAISGSGDVTLNGNTENFTSKTSGSGDVDASKMKAKNATVSISGSGDTSVFCSENLYARVSGSGDVKYNGNPAKKDTKVSGSGEIIKF